MLERLTRLNGILSYILLWISGAGLLAMTGIIGWQVVARYVLNASPSWAEQLSLILMIWYALLAAAAGFHEGFHIKILALQNAVSPSKARNMRLITEMIILLCGVMMLIWGIELTMIINSHVIPSLGISRSWAYLPLPISGALIILFSATRVFGEVTRPGWTELPPEPGQDDPNMLNTADAGKAGDA